MERIVWRDDEEKKVLAEYNKCIAEGMFQKPALEKAQQVLPPHRRRQTIHTQFIWEFNNKYKAALARKELPELATQSQIADRRAANGRVEWTDEERELLAMGWVEARVTNPFESPGPLFEQVQRQLLDGTRQRSLASLKVDAKLYERICVLWKEQTSKAEPPAPRVIEIPVERPVNFMEIAHRLDFPTLMALVFDKAQKHFSAIKIEVPTKPTPDTSTPPPISLLEATKPPPTEKRNPRVAFCYVDAPMASQVQSEVEHNKIPVDIRMVDLASREQAIPLSCDYVVFTQRLVGSKGWKAARDTWPQSKIFIVPDHMRDVVQKMRDIASMQTPTIKLPIQ